MHIFIKLTFSPQLCLSNSFSFQTLLLPVHLFHSSITYSQGESAGKRKRVREGVSWYKRLHISRSELKNESLHLIQKNGMMNNRRLLCLYRNAVLGQPICNLSCDYKAFGKAYLAIFCITCAKLLRNQS